MNIKEHIESGHYPVDDKGRALVPMASDRVAIIYCTDHGEGFCVLGRDPAKSLRAWDCAGRNQYGPQDDLLPPPHRKVKVTATLRHCGGASFEIERWSRTASGPFPERVELTGEYEEPWS